MPKRNALAAVDLGTNSFHMVVARQTSHQFVIIDRLREMVRLGDGVDDDGRFDPKVAARDSRPGTSKTPRVKQSEADDTIEEPKQPAA